MEKQISLTKANSNGTTSSANVSLAKNTVSLTDNRPQSILQKKQADGVKSDSLASNTIPDTIIQRVSIDDLKEKRDLRIFLRTLTGTSLTEEQAAHYLQVIQSNFPEYRGSATLQEAITAMPVAGFTRFHSLIKPPSSEPSTVGLKGIRELAAKKRSLPPRNPTAGIKLAPLGTAPKLPAKLPLTSSKPPVVVPGKKVLVPLKKPPIGTTTGTRTGASFRIKKVPPTGTKTTTGGQVDRLEAEGVQPMGALPWTHNTSAHGLLGVLTTGQFLSTVERNVNFRYDLDSRYHQGVSMVMRPQLEWCWDGSHVQDLYHQSEHLRGASERVSADGGRRVYTKTAGHAAKDDHTDPRLQKMREHLHAVSLLSDFRDTQLNKLGEKGKLKPTDKKATKHTNYELSIANPQLRVPVEQPIGFSHIDFVIITKEVDTILKQWEKGIGLDEVEKGTKAFLKKQTVVHNQSLPSNVRMGIKRLQEMRKRGNIIVVNNSGFSHEAGRMEDRKAKDSDAMEEAAGQGLEHGDNYFHPEMNNSPSALDMETFLQFQEAYYKRLAQQDKQYAAREIAAAILKKRGIDVPKSTLGSKGGGSGSTKKDKIPTQALVNGPGREHTLTAYQTEADGSCGIHAMLGAMDVDGVIRHNDPQTVRQQLAQRIAEGRVDMGRYGTMIRELIREILSKINMRVRLSADEALLFHSFEGEAGFVDIVRLFQREQNAFAELGVQRNITEETIVQQVRTDDAGQHALQDYLIQAIAGSNSASDAEARTQLLSVGSVDARRGVLRSFSVEYLKRVIAGNRDAVIHILQTDHNPQGDQYAAHVERGNWLRQRVDLAANQLYAAHINSLLTAYSRVVLNGEYYLRDNDLREIAEIQNRNLIIYRQGDGGTYQEHVRHNVAAPAGNDMHVYHSGAHYEQGYLA